MPNKRLKTLHVGNRECNDLYVAGICLINAHWVQLMSLGDLEWYLNVMIWNEGGLKKQGKESVLKLEEKYEKMFGP